MGNASWSRVTSVRHFDHRIPISKKKGDADADERRRRMQNTGRYIFITSMKDDAVTRE